jgi:hypothetical protein
MSNRLPIYIECDENGPVCHGFVGDIRAEFVAPATGSFVEYRPAVAMCKTCVSTIGMSLGLWCEALDRIVPPDGFCHEHPENRGDK